MDKKVILQEILDIENISSLIPKCPKITLDMLLSTLSKSKYTLNVDLGLSSVTCSKYMKVLWPDKPKGNSKIDGWLLSKYGYKECKECLSVKYIEDFSLNSARLDGIGTYCKKCYLETTRDYQREYQKRRKELKNNRMPKWADISKIKEIYYNCPEGYHVDHIVPLQGTLVSGLHVEYNLQYLLAEDNLKKHNKFEV